MATNYPQGIDDTTTLPILVDNSSKVNASSVNIIRNAVVAIEGALGTKPAGIYGTVRERQDNLEAVVNTINSSLNALIIAPKSDGYSSVEYNGVRVGTGFFANLNFSGAGVSVSGSGSTANITIAGGGGGGGSFTAGGDLTGTSTNQTVAKIQGVSISGTPSSGKALLGTSTTTAAWGTIGSGGTPSGSAGGDLSSTYPNPTVAKINGATVPAAGGLTAGNVLTVSASSTLTYAPVNVGAGTAHITGILPAANQASQTVGGDLSGSTSSASVVKLRGVSVSATSPTDAQVLTYDVASTSWKPANSAGGGGGSFTAGGDLGGTSLSQTVLALTGATGTLPVASTGAIIQWSSSATSPTLKQADTTVGSATGQALSIKAMNATGATSTGGALILTSGTGTSNPGAVRIQTGAVDRLVLSPVSMTLVPTQFMRTGNANTKLWDDYTSIQTTTATQATAYSFTLANNAATHLDVLIMAINSGKTAGGSFKRSADFRTLSGTSTQINATLDAGSNLDTGLSWSATIDHSGTTARVLITGAASTTIRWSVYVSVLEDTA